MSDEIQETSNALSLSPELHTSLLNDIREALRIEEQDIREKDAEEQAEIKADEQRFEHHLVVIELGTVFVAVVAIIVMERMRLGGVCEVGTLIPTCVLALFRIIRS